MLPHLTSTWWQSFHILALLLPIIIRELISTTHVISCEETELVCYTNYYVYYYNYMNYYYNNYIYTIYIHVISCVETELVYYTNYYV